MYHQPPAHLAHQAWRDGIELYWAVAKFASAKSRDMTEQMMKGEAKLPVPTSNQALTPGSTLEAIAKLGLMVAGAFYPPDRRDVVDQLLGGRLVAFGFKMPRELSNPPTEIPKRVWTGKADFKNGTLTGIGFTFVDVRVIPQEAWRTILDNPLTDEKVRPTGRPGLKREIFSALEEEHSETSVCENYKEIGRVARIRSRLTVLYPDRAETWRELNDETINKYRREFCEDCAAKSPTPSKATQ